MINDAEELVTRVLHCQAEGKSADGPAVDGPAECERSGSESEGEAVVVVVEGEGGDANLQTMTTDHMRHYPISHERA